MVLVCHHFQKKCYWVQRVFCHQKKAKTFDELRVSVFNTYSKALNLKKMSCSSTALREHIKRAYIQTNLWIIATLPHRPIIERRHFTDGNYPEICFVPTLLPEGLVSDYNTSEFTRTLQIQEVCFWSPVSLPSKQAQMLLLLWMLKKHQCMPKSILKIKFGIINWIIHYLINTTIFMVICMSYYILIFSVNMNDIVSINILNNYLLWAVAAL